MNAPPSDAAAGAAAFGIFGAMAIFYVLFFAIAIAGLVLWILALIDCVKRQFPGENDKLMWILVIVLAGWIGALIYWFVGRPKGTLPA